MKTAYWIGSLVIALIVLGIIVLAKNSQMTTQTETASSTESAQVTSTTTSTTTVTTPTTSGNSSGNTSATPPAAPAAKHFTVNGNDQTADLKAITLAAGTPVTITFGADAGTTYHGGLDYRSSVLNTGTIAPGSTKTVSFTATHSFSFTPYWPATNIAKPYTISIVVN